MNVMFFTLPGGVLSRFRPKMNKFRTKTEQYMNKN